METSSRTDRVLVMGLGNRIMTDDAAGLFALDLFRERFDTPEGVDYLEGGTLGLELLVYMDGYGSILIADCVLGRGKPGEVVRIEAPEVDAVFQRCLSPHQMGLKDLIAVMNLQGRTPANLTVVGVEGKEIGLGTELTSEVGESIPEVVSMMAEVLKSWGCEVRERS